MTKKTTKSIQKGATFYRISKFPLLNTTCSRVGYTSTLADVTETSLTKETIIIVYYTHVTDQCLIRVFSIVFFLNRRQVVIVYDGLIFFFQTLRLFT